MSVQLHHLRDGRSLLTVFQLGDVWGADIYLHKMDCMGGRESLLTIGLESNSFGNLVMTPLNIMS